MQAHVVLPFQNVRIDKKIITGTKKEIFYIFKINNALFLKKGVENLQ